MNRLICENATEYINALPRIQSSYTFDKIAEETLFLSSEIKIEIDVDSNAILTGLEKTKDSKAKDMLRIIILHDAETISYTETKVISPSLYVHSLKDKPWHITTQCILITFLSEDGVTWVEKENNKCREYYGKHEMDSFWLPFCKNVSTIKNTDPVFILNRRISGWDGSLDRPVVELLGAGGHLQAVWNGEKFVSRDLKENLKKEFSEEVGLVVQDSDLHCVGGFANEKTQELVVLFCAFVDEKLLPIMQNHAIGNMAEDTDGLYLGAFADVVAQYKKDPSFFAGGNVAAATNFPNNDFLMKKVYALLNLNE